MGDGARRPTRLTVAPLACGWCMSGWLERRRVRQRAPTPSWPNLHMLRDRTDLAVLWDLRVDHNARRLGAGAALFRASEAWARERGCSALEVETQQINVPACRLYARMGCSLAAVDRYAYAELPREVQLIWRRQLGLGASRR